MKTNMNTRRKTSGESGAGVSIEECKLERLKMAGAYGSAVQARAWAEGIRARQADVGCAVVRRPKRSVSRRKGKIQTAAGRSGAVRGG